MLCEWRATHLCTQFTGLCTYFLSQSCDGTILACENHGSVINTAECEINFILVLQPVHYSDPCFACAAELPLQQVKISICTKKGQGYISPQLSKFHSHSRKLWFLFTTELAHSARNSMRRSEVRSMCILMYVLASPDAFHDIKPFTVMFFWTQPVWPSSCFSWLKAFMILFWTNLLTFSFDFSQLSLALQNLF